MRYQYQSDNPQIADSRFADRCALFSILQDTRDRLHAVHQIQTLVNSRIIYTDIDSLFDVNDLMVSYQSVKVYSEIVLVKGIQLV